MAVGGHEARWDRGRAVCGALLSLAVGKRSWGFGRERPTLVFL